MALKKRNLRSKSKQSNKKKDKNQMDKNKNISKKTKKCVNKSKSFIQNELLSNIIKCPKKKVEKKIKLPISNVAKNCDSDKTIDPIELNLDSVKEPSSDTTPGNEAQVPSPLVEKKGRGRPRKAGWKKIDRSLSPRPRGRPRKTMEEHCVDRKSLLSLLKKHGPSNKLPEDKKNHLMLLLKKNFIIDKTQTDIKCAFSGDKLLIKYLKNNQMLPQQRKFADKPDHIPDNLNNNYKYTTKPGTKYQQTYLSPSVQTQKEHKMKNPPNKVTKTSNNQHEVPTPSQTDNVQTGDRITLAMYRKKYFQHQTSPGFTSFNEKSSLPILRKPPNIVPDNSFSSRALNLDFMNYIDTSFCDKIQSYFCEHCSYKASLKLLITNHIKAHHWNILENKHWNKLPNC